MNDFFDQFYFDNTVGDYSITLAIILFILLLNRIISKYFAGLIFSLVKKVWKNANKKSFTDLLIHPLAMFVMVCVFIIAVHRLHFPGQWDVEVYNYTLRDIFASVGTTILIISFIWLLLRMIDFAATTLQRRAEPAEDLSDSQLIVFFKDFFKVLLCIAGLLMTLHFAFNLDVGNLLTGLSIVGAAIALSLRESLENLIASFVIFFDKPFTTGDVVKVQTITGTVEKIGLRSTRIRTDRKTYVTVPNKQMVDSILDNLSLRTQHKGELRLEIDLNTSSKKLQELLNRIRTLLNRNGINRSTVFLNAIAGNAFMIHGDYFTAHITETEFNSVKEGINMSVLELLENLEIQIAGANRELRIIAPEKQELKQ